MKFPLLASAALLLKIVHAIEGLTLVPISVYSQHVTGPLSSNKGSLVTSINYDSATFETEVLSYHPPPTENTTAESFTSHPLLRISLHPEPQGNDRESTTVTSLSTFNPAYTQIFTLHLNDDGSPVAASFSVDQHTTPSSSNLPESKLKVVLLRPTPGPTPKLNAQKPVVVDADGKEVPQVPEVEKSFFQKYWWAFALMAVLALSGSGDSK